MKREIVLPGDRVAVGEEYLAGPGTYEFNGDVYAAQMGELDLDNRDKVARVRSFNPPVELRVGDIVLATVEDLKSTMVIVRIQAVEGVQRQITGETEATIHISKVSERYTEDIKREFRLGDVIRARVIQVKPSVQLGTNEQTLGVVLGLCTRCRARLIKKGRQLYCERCERTEPRKVSTVYNALLSRAKG